MYTYTINDVAKLLNKTVPEIRSSKHINLEDLSTVVQAYNLASRELRNARFEYNVKEQCWALSWEDMRDKTISLGVKPAPMFDNEGKSVPQEWPRNMYDNLALEKGSVASISRRASGLSFREKIEYSLSTVTQLYGRLGVVTVLINGAPILDHERKPHTFFIHSLEAGASMDLTGGNPPRGVWISTGWNSTES